VSSTGQVAYAYQHPDVVLVALHQGARAQEDNHVYLTVQDAMGEAYVAAVRAMPDAVAAQSELLLDGVPGGGRGDEAMSCQELAMPRDATSAIVMTVSMVTRRYLVSAS
jgi:hypothetical protein